MEDNHKEDNQDNEQEESQEKLAAKHDLKDSLFSDLFSDKQYLLQLYQALHPEDTVATEDDLTEVTIKNVFLNGIYNDIGFQRGERFIILVECQVKWSMNIWKIGRRRSYGL